MIRLDTSLLRTSSTRERISRTDPSCADVEETEEGPESSTDHATRRLQGGTPSRDVCTRSGVSLDLREDATMVCTKGACLAGLTPNESFWTFGFLSPTLRFSEATAALGKTALARIWSAISSEVAMSSVPIGRLGEVALSAPRGRGAEPEWWSANH
jgi:hypothetical protein